MALSEYSATKRIIHNFTSLKGVVKGGDFYDDDHFKYFKINGSADCIDNGSFVFLNADYSLGYEIELVQLIIRNYFRLINCKISPALSFAWENERMSGGKRMNITEITKRDVSDTDILVIIGYSFPFFNREIDREIIGGMDLKKVYIQDINAPAILDRFMTIRQDLPRENIILKQDDMEQFFIPHEL